MGNILNHNSLPFTFRLNTADCWDFHLSRAGFGSVPGGLSERCLASYIELGDKDCVMMDGLYSKDGYKWDCAYNDSVDFENIGFTGVDNGIVAFDRDLITNEEYIKLYTESCLHIEGGDTRLILRKVDGNNKLYDYGVAFDNVDGRECVRLKGGFYQGFFKTDGYQVLPSDISDGTNFEVVLKPETNITDVGDTLNGRHPGNDGFFLFIGTRSENKWWTNYKVDEVFDGNRNDYFTDGYASDERYKNGDDLNSSYYDEHDVGYAYDDYFADGYGNDEDCIGTCRTVVDTIYGEDGRQYKIKYPEAYATYRSNDKKFDGKGGVWVENEIWTTAHNKKAKQTYVRKKCNCDKYLSGRYSSSDGYFDDNSTSACSSYFAGGYLRKEKPIDENAEVKSVDGHSMNQPNLIEIVSDNKFLMFDRTDEGVTTANWEESSEVVITDIHIPDEENGFLLYDRSDGGMTIKEYAEIRAEKSKKYSVIKDLRENAIGFRITSEGAIGYRYLVTDCDNGGYKIEEHYTSDGTVSSDAWHCINVSLKPVSSGKMVISIYIDGKLRFVSKDLPKLRLRWLDDMHDKQESVPYCISLGGGTQGLCDVLYLNYRKRPEYLLPLEKHFAGSFFGCVSAFRVYACPMTFNEITGNAEFEGCF